MITSACIAHRCLKDWAQSRALQHYSPMHLVTSIFCIPEQAVEFPHTTSCRRQLDLACRLLVTDFKGGGIIDDGWDGVP